VIRQRTFGSVRASNGETFPSSNSGDGLDKLEFHPFKWGFSQTHSFLWTPSVRCFSSGLGIFDVDRRTFVSPVGMEVLLIGEKGGND
jgi:hypothetical protein